MNMRFLVVLLFLGLLAQTARAGYLGILKGGVTAPDSLETFTIPGKDNAPPLRLFFHDGEDPSALSAIASHIEKDSKVTLRAPTPAKSASWPALEGKIERRQQSGFTVQVNVPSWALDRLDGSMDGEVSFAMEIRGDR